VGSGFIEKQNQNKKKSSQFWVFQNPWRPNFSNISESENHGFQVYSRKKKKESNICQF
jgi:hypothetical protein